MTDFRSDHDLRRELLHNMGVLSYEEQETIIDIAKRCSRTAGVSMAAGWTILGSSVPGYGTLAGFLGGWVIATAACMALN